MPVLIQSKNGIVWDAEKEPNPNSLGNGSRNSFLWNCYHNDLGKMFQFKCKNAIKRAVKTVHQRFTPNFEGDYLTLQSIFHEVIRTRITDEPDVKQPVLFDISDILVYYAKNEKDIEKLRKNKLFVSSVELAHRCIKIYDKESFVYEDERLQKISNVLTTEITSNFSNNSTFLKVANIIVFLMKEDIYYRARFIKMLQDLRHAVSELGISSILINILLKLCETCKDFTFTSIELENMERWR